MLFQRVKVYKETSAVARFPYNCSKGLGGNVAHQLERLYGPNQERRIGKRWDNGHVYSLWRPIAHFAFVLQRWAYRTRWKTFQWLSHSLSQGYEGQRSGFVEYMDKYESNAQLAKDFGQRFDMTPDLSPYRDKWNLFQRDFWTRNSNSSLSRWNGRLSQSP